MACRIAENKPLKKLASDLDLQHMCHSLRGDCIQSLERAQGEAVMGSPGAVLGYCQGLFVNSDKPEKHTSNLIKWLEDINAPHPKSHELLWTNRNSESATEYIDKAMQPLIGTGRVPVIITSYDTATDRDAINEILSADAKIYEGETALVRVYLGSAHSKKMSAISLERMTKEVEEKRSIPKFWTLMQGDFPAKDWDKLRQSSGKYWQYANVAATPFTSDEVLENLRDNITVAQFLVSSKKGIHADGTIEVSKEACIGQEVTTRTYNIYEYAQRLSKNGILPTSIICGPSNPEWSIGYNKDRLETYLSHYKAATKDLWPSLKKDKRSEILALPA
jgi:hypothetical protein